VKPSPENLEALGLDFEPFGNEGRQLFAWPAVRVGQGEIFLAEGEDYDPQGPALEEARLGELVELLPSPVSIKPGIGFMVIGPRWIEDARRMRDLQTDWFIRIIQAQAMEVSHGFRAMPVGRHSYTEIARHFGSEALRIFDEAIAETYASWISERGEAAFNLLNAETSLPYEKRVIRRLLYFRIKNDYERHQSVLETAQKRLELSEEALLKRITDALDVLKEAHPYERTLMREGEIVREQAGTSDLSQEITREMKNAESFEEAIDAAFVGYGLDAQQSEQEGAPLEHFVRLRLITEKEVQDGK
jgi:hypothetical protein